MTQGFAVKLNYVKMQMFTCTFGKHDTNKSKKKSFNSSMVIILVNTWSDSDHNFTSHRDSVKVGFK